MKIHKTKCFLCGCEPMYYEEIYFSTKCSNYNCVLSKIGFMVNRDWEELQSKIREIYLSGVKEGSKTRELYYKEEETCWCGKVMEDGVCSGDRRSRG